MTTKAHDALAETTTTGKFVRTASGFRKIIGSEVNAEFTPEFDRYHLYISYACPWANRCLATINMKGLQDCIKFTAVHPTWQKTRPNDPEDKHSGWAFSQDTLASPTGFGAFKTSGNGLDTINGAKFIRDLYEMSNDEFHKYSVPVLWDKKTNQIVNNESSEIVRMFTTVFDEWATGSQAKLDLYPEALRTEIDAANDWIAAPSA